MKDKVKVDLQNEGTLNEGLNLEKEELKVELGPVQQSE